MKQRIFYDSYTDDVVENSNQDYELPPDYQWIRKGVWNKVMYALGYALALTIAFVYLRFVRHVHYHGRYTLWKFRRNGYIIYGNHTQPFGDPFIPLLACLGKRAFGIAGTANLGIPFIGKLLPYMGALPLVNTKYGMKKLHEAVAQRIAEKHVVFMYPEAHVWPYYTQIRRFPASAMHYQQQLECLSFTLTTTYRKRLIGKRPRIDVYVDGPFYPQHDETPRMQRLILQYETILSMQNNAQKSNYQYIEYVKRNEHTA